MDKILLKSSSAFNHSWWVHFCLLFIFLLVVEGQQPILPNSPVMMALFNLSSAVPAEVPQLTQPVTAVPIPEFLTNSTVTRPTFTGHIPIHLLPSNKIVDYFPWEVEIGLQVCPYAGMLLRARRGSVPPNSTDEERLDDLRNFPSPHCSVECECIGTGNYQCRSICPGPPNDMDFCVPVAVPGQCCHKYICDDELDSAFPALRYPEPTQRTLLMCMPDSILPDSVCHSIFPKAFSGHLGPKGICFDYDDIRCAWLDDNEIPSSVNSQPDNREARINEPGRVATQTIFFQTARNGTVFSTDIPLKKSKRKLRV